MNKINSKKIGLYFGDAFWCTTPYVFVNLYYSLKKYFDVIPIFLNNDIRIAKKNWTGNEKFFFDKEVFEKLPYKTTNDLKAFYLSSNLDLILMTCHFQFKPQFSKRNLDMKKNGCNIGMIDIGGCDSLYTPSSIGGWQYFFSKGKIWKDVLTGKNKLSLAYPAKGANENEENIFVTGTLDYEEASMGKSLNKVSFCKKYNLDINKEIIAYIPANPGPDNSYTYPSGITAKQALDDINNTLIKLTNLGYQVCLKSHPGDYVEVEVGKGFSAIHPRSKRGGYNKARYCEGKFKNFTTINAEDGFNLYKNCTLAVTNYSHAGWELFLHQKPVFSYRMKETNEWMMIKNICEKTYKDNNSGSEMLQNIVNNRYIQHSNNKNFEYFFENINKESTTVEKITQAVIGLVNEKRI